MIELSGIISEVFTFLWMWVFVAFILNRLFDEAQDRSMNNRWGVWKVFLNANQSSTRKWALNEQGNKQPFQPKWYYLGFTCDYKERFFLSSTALVFLTDGEHLFQWFKNRMVEIAFIPINWWLVAAALSGNVFGSQLKERFKGWQ